VTVTMESGINTCAVTGNQPDTKSNPNPNPKATKRHAVVTN